MKDAAAATQRINLGIAIMHATRDERPLSLREIAAYCGCSWQAIWHIEQKAMRKLRTAAQRRGLTDSVMGRTAQQQPTG